MRRPRARWRARSLVGAFGPFPRRPRYLLLREIVIQFGGADKRRRRILLCATSRIDLQE